MKNLAYLITIGFIVACQSNPQSEQKLEQIDKNSAREVVLSATEVGDTVYHLTTQKIWQNNQVVAEKIDTITTVKSWKDTIKVPIYVTIQ